MGNIIQGLQADFPKDLLHGAALLGNLSLIRDLLEDAGGLDVSLREEDGAAPIHYLFRGQLFKPALMELLEFLVSRGADVNAKDSNGLTPLHFALNSKVGADVNAQEPTNGESMSPEEYHELVKLVIERKLESAFLLRNIAAFTPLHSAMFLEEHFEAIGNLEYTKNCHHPPCETHYSNW